MRHYIGHSITMVPTSHFYTSQRLKLHYLDWGNHSAPPLLLLHGVRDHARSWDWVAAQLSEHWHVIVPDLRGHGDSEWTSDGNYRTEDFIYDLHQMVTILNFSPVTIISHSLGGHIALRYAGLYPDAMHKLVAIEGLGYSPKQLEERARITKADHLRQWLADKGNSETRTPKRYASFADAVERMHADNDYLSEAQVLHLTKHALRTNADGSFSWKFDNHLNKLTGCLRELGILRS